MFMKRTALLVLILMFLGNSVSALPNRGSLRPDTGQFECTISGIAFAQDGNIIRGRQDQYHAIAFSDSSTDIKIDFASADFIPPGVNESKAYGEIEVFGIRSGSPLLNKLIDPRAYFSIDLDDLESAVNLGGTNNPYKYPLDGTRSQLFIANDNNTYVAYVIALKDILVRTKIELQSPVTTTVIREVEYTIVFNTNRFNPSDSSLTNGFPQRINEKLPGGIREDKTLSIPDSLFGTRANSSGHSRYTYGFYETGQNLQAYYRNVEKREWNSSDGVGDLFQYTGLSLYSIDNLNGLNGKTPEELKTYLNTCFTSSYSQGAVSIQANNGISVDSMSINPELNGNTYDFNIETGAIPQGAKGYHVDISPYKITLDTENQNAYLIHYYDVNINDDEIVNDAFCLLIRGTDDLQREGNDSFQIKPQQNNGHLIHNDGVYDSRWYFRNGENLILQNPLNDDLIDSNIILNNLLFPGLFRVAFTIHDSQNNGVYARTYLSRSSVNNIQEVFDLSSLAETKHYIHVLLEDRFSNTINKDLPFYIDRTPPVQPKKNDFHFSIVNDTSNPTEYQLNIFADRNVRDQGGSANYPSGFSHYYYQLFQDEQLWMESFLHQETGDQSTVAVMQPLARNTLMYLNAQSLDYVENKSAGYTFSDSQEIFLAYPVFAETIWPRLDLLKKNKVYDSTDFIPDRINRSVTYNPDFFLQLQGHVDPDPESDFNSRINHAIFEVELLFEPQYGTVNGTAVHAFRKTFSGTSLDDLTSSTNGICNKIKFHPVLPSRLRHQSLNVSIITRQDIDPTPEGVKIVEESWPVGNGTLYVENYRDEYDLFLVTGRDSVTGEGQYTVNDDPLSASVSGDQTLYFVFGTTQSRCRDIESDEFEFDLVRTGSEEAVNSFQPLVFSRTETGDLFSSYRVFENDKLLDETRNFTDSIDPELQQVILGRIDRDPARYYTVFAVPAKVFNLPKAAEYTSFLMDARESWQICGGGSDSGLVTSGLTIQYDRYIDEDLGNVEFYRRDSVGNENSLLDGVTNQDEVTIRISGFAPLDIYSGRDDFHRIIIEEIRPDGAVRKTIVPRTDVIVADETLTFDYTILNDDMLDKTDLEMPLEYNISIQDISENNASIMGLQMEFDTIEPYDPQRSDYDFIEHGKALEIRLLDYTADPTDTGQNDIVAFEWCIDGQTETVLLLNQPTVRSFELAPYGPETAVPVEITAIDNAGNRSVVPLRRNVYTPAVFPSEAAEPDTLVRITTNPSEVGFDFRTILDANGSGYRIERRQDVFDIPFVIPQLKDTVISETNTLYPDCLWPLQPHETYLYHVYPVNADGKYLEHVYKPLDVTMANHSPTTVMSTEPVGDGSGILYVRADGQYFWQTSQDADPGDGLEYFFILTDLDSLRDFTFGPFDSGEPRSLKQIFDFPLFDGETPLLTDESRWSWRVDVQDYWDAPSSPGNIVPGAETEFSVDDTVPSLFWDDRLREGIFITDDSFSVRIVDKQPGSGLAAMKAVEYVSGSPVSIAFEPVVVARSAGTEQEVVLSSLPDGTYAVIVTVTDKAGNTVAYDRIIRMDTVPGRFGGVGIGDRTISGPSVPVTITGIADDGSAPRRFRYRWINTATGESGSERYIDLPLQQNNESTGGSVDHFETDLALQGQDGGRYRLEARIEDWAGNLSDFRTASDQIVLLDRSGPVFTAAEYASGVRLSYGRLFLHNPESLRLRVGYADPHSEPADLYFAIRDDDNTQLISWTDDPADLNRLDLLNGETYRVGLKALNETGAETVHWLERFCFDRTPGRILSAVLDHSGSVRQSGRGWGQTAQRVYVDGSTIMVSVSAEDAESGIENLFLGIGTTNNPTSITGQTNGNLNGWMFANGAAGEFRMALPEGTENGDYIVSVYCFNGAGLSSEILTVGEITVNNDVETVVVKESSAFTSRGDVFPAEWFFSEDPGRIKTWRYKVLEEGLPFWIYGEWRETDRTALNIDLSSEPMEHGKTYILYVWGFDERDRPVGWPGASRGVTADLEPVRCLDLSADDYSDGQDVHLEWSVAESLSGLESVTAVVTAAERDGDGHYILDPRTELPRETILGQIPLPAVSEGSGVFSLNTAGIELEHGERFSATLQFVNRAGAIAEARTEAVVVDWTPPARPLILDQGEAVNPADSVTADWRWSGGDPESGCFYSWTWIVGDEPVGSREWRGDDGTRFAELYPADTAGLSDGNRIRFAVKAVNGLGRETVGISDGIVLDSAAPRITSILIPDAGGDGEKLFIDNPDVLVEVRAWDDSSSIAEISVSAGRLNTDTGDLLDFREEVSSPDQTLIYPLDPDVIKDGDVIVFRASAADAAGNRSLDGHSRGVLFDGRRPLVFNINGVYSNGRVLFDWASGWEDQTGLTPITSYDLILYRKDGTALTELSTWHSVSRKTSLEAESLGNGRYVLEITAVTASGSRSIAVNSPVVTVDLTPPEIDGFRTNPYTSTVAAFECRGSEDLSAINQYQYAVGTFEEPLAVTGRWISRLTNADFLSEELPLSESFCGVDGLTDGSRLYVRMRIRNSAGLWSAYEMSPPILIDKTPADVLDFRIEKILEVFGLVKQIAGTYTNSSTSVSHVTFSAADDQSGIYGYQYAVDSVPDSAGTNLAWRNITDSELSTGPGTAYTVSDDIWDGFALEENRDYYLYLRIRNGALDYSPAVVYGPVRTDFTTPSLTFRPEGGLITETIDGGKTRVIANSGDVSVPVDLAENISEQVFVRYSVVSPTNQVHYIFSDYLLSGGSGEESFLFPTDRFEELYGEYRITAEIVDEAGNGLTTEEGALVRFNSPPDFTPPEYYLTFPGKPFGFRIADSDTEPGIVRDTDGDAVTEIFWDIPGLGGGSGDVYEGPLFHHPVLAQQTVWPMSLTAVDEYGQSATIRLPLVVENTRYGMLYTDEYWLQDHELRNDITVPDGLELWIGDAPADLGGYRGPAVTVTATGNSVTGYDHELLIDGFLHCRDTLFRLDAPEKEMVWTGIRIRGKGHLQDAVITGAARGLTVMAAAQTVLKDLILRNNTIGLHLVGASPEIRNFLFEENRFYAIKEDSGAEPAVNNNRFLRNGYDYYDDVRRIISLDELNNKNGNDGNQGE